MISAESVNKESEPLPKPIDEKHEILELLKKWILKTLTASPINIPTYQLLELIEKELEIEYKSPIITQAFYELQIQMQMIWQERLK